MPPGWGEAADRWAEVLAGTTDPGRTFTIACYVCGREFGLPGGPDTAVQLDALFRHHVEAKHKALYEEVEDLYRQGVHADFAEIMARQSFKGEP